MNNTAQIILTDFENTWLTIDWNLLTEIEKQAHIFNHYELKINSTKEIENNRITGEIEYALALEEAKLQKIAILNERGFACDNSLSDWEKVFNKPEIFGVNWQEQAQAHFNLQLGLDYFINYAYIQ